MRSCLDEGIIQAFLDGELDAAAVEHVAQHVALCDDCAVALSESEQETEFAFAALEHEFDTLVPTQRLWTKINASLESDAKSRSLWQRLTAAVSGWGFQMSMPSVAAFASLLIVFGLFVALFSIKPENSNEFVAQRTEPRQEPAVTVTNPASAVAPGEKVAPGDPIEEADQVNLASAKPQAPKAAFTKAVYTEKDNRPAREIKSRKTETDQTPIVTAPAYLPGEESYVKTIATLSETVDSRKDTALKPSARFAYEKDMAVIDDAIEKMRKEVKKNPSNKAAKRVLYATYQNKIDLLNAVTEKTELMASLR